MDSLPKSLRLQDSITALQQHPYAVNLIFAVVTVVLVWRFFDPYSGRFVPGAPIVGAGSRFEPLFITRYRFTLGCASIVSNNWRKFLDKPFTVVRPDGNLTVLPRKYVPELRQLPMEKLNVIQLLCIDMGGDYTGFGIHAESRLSFNVIQSKISPRLGRGEDGLDSYLAERLQSAFREYAPKCKVYKLDGWVEVKMGDMVLKMLSHITTPLFVGPPLCDDAEFLHLNCVFVGEVFLTAIAMRQFPPFMHPIVVRCLPSYWKLLKMKQKIASFLIPVIRERQRSQRANPNVEKRKDVLQYMIDMAGNEKEADPSNMAVRYIFTIIGSVHSVVAAATDTIYELVERPEYIQPLLGEVDQALKETGGEWGKEFASKLLKMDSFMKETQRVKPTTPISHRCIVKEPLTFADGFHVPKGAFVGIPSMPIPESEMPFDGFRYYKESIETGQLQRQFTTLDADHAQFGIGRYACPGRYMASMQIKFVVAKLFTNYDVKFPEAQGVPKVVALMEFCLRDPEAKTMIKEKK